MNSVALLIWKDLRMFKNYLVQMKNNPKRILIFVLYIALFGYLGYNNMSSRSETSQMFSGLMGHGMALMMIVLILVTNAVTAFKDMANAFAMGDVNLIFTSPMSSKVILFSSYIKKLFLAIFPAIFICFMMGSTSGGGSNPVLSVILGFLGFYLLSITFEPINFIFLKLDPFIDKKKLQGGLVAIFVAMLLGVLFYVGDVLTFIQSPLVHYIPIIGWTKALLVSIYGIQVDHVWLFLALQSITTIGLYVIAISMGSDYYEDVLLSSESISNFRRKAKEGKQENIFSFNIFKNKKVTIAGNASGLKAFLWKRKIERSRSSIHYLVGLTTIAQFLAGIGILVFVLITDDYHWAAYAVNGVVAYLMLLSSMSNKKSEEYEYPYFFTIPGNNAMKLLRLYQLELMSVILGTLLLNIPMMFIPGINIGMLALCLLAVNVFYLLMFFSNLVVRVFFSNSRDYALMVPLMKVIQIAVVILPVLGVVFGITRFTEDDTIIISAIAITYALLLALLVGLAGLLVRRMEYHK